MIEVKNLSKSYDKNGRNLIFDQVSFEVNDGDFVVLKGVSGAGKSTLLNMIGGLELATSGQVMIDGVDVSVLRGKERADFYREKIGFVFQGFYLQPQLSVADNIALSGIFAGVRKDQRRERVEELAGELGIENVLALKPAEISGGQAERVAVARAIFMRPKLLLVDEPTNNLDHENAKKVMDLLKWAGEESRATVIVASHDSLVAKYATRVIEVKDGKVLA